MVGGRKPDVQEGLEWKENGRVQSSWIPLHLEIINYVERKGKGITDSGCEGK